MMKEENTERRKELRNRRFDLQERFIKYVSDIIRLSENIPDTKVGKHIYSQILKKQMSELQFL